MQWSTKQTWLHWPHTCEHMRHACHTSFGVMHQCSTLKLSQVTSMALQSHLSAGLLVGTLMQSSCTPMARSAAPIQIYRCEPYCCFTPCFRSRNLARERREIMPGFG